MIELSTNRGSEVPHLLGGDYQSKNLQAVYNAFSLLKNIFKVSEKNITEGIRKVVINTGLHGRWQILSSAFNYM